MRRALLAALAAVAVVPSQAHAHAVLERTVPARGAALDAAPRAVSFTFNEPVEASFGALRVYDASGDRVDDGRVTRPGGRADTLAVGLRDGVGDGRYTATYRVVSADSHPVSGGSVFTVGDAAATSAVSVSDLLEDSSAGPVTTTAFGVVRGAGYAALAATLGALAFLVVVWAPALTVLASPARAPGGASAAPGPASSARASAALRRRLGRVLAVAVVAGAATSALSLVFQAALAGGTPVWSALDAGALGEVLDTRFGAVSAVRLGAWVLLGAALTFVLRGRRAALPIAAACAVAAALTFGLGGHAGSTEPAALMLATDAAHVVAMGTWIGGLLMLVAVVPAATRALEHADRTRLLAAVLGRFSPLAVAAVAVLVATGALQSVVHLDAVADLWETAFGRAIAVKVVVLGGLVALGALNQRRLAPRLRALAASGAPPGVAGRRLRAALRAEVALAVAVLGVTAALVSYAPASAGDGVLARSFALGPARVELTVEPLRAGPHEVHVYLFDAATGAALERLDELTVTASLPDEDLGPIEVDLRRAGPGHFTTRAAPISPAGDWELDLKLRTNRFDIDRAEIPLEVRE